MDTGTNNSNPVMGENDSYDYHSEDEDLSDETIMREPYCRRCRGKKNDIGYLVCSDCWESYDNGFKYYEGTFNDWLKMMLKEDNIIKVDVNNKD